MLTLRELRAAKPGVFQSITGVSPKEFDALVARVEPRYRSMERDRLERTDRMRAPGAGAKSRYDVAERLLMTLVWLRQYLTCEAVGFLFGVDKGTVSRYTRPILLILRDIGVDTLGWPEEAKEVLEAIRPGSGESGASDATPGDLPVDPPTEVSSDQAGESTVNANWPKDPVEEAEILRKTEAETVVTPDQSSCPDWLAIIDATEQRVERAKVYATQKMFYSGKKKTHTIKTQIIVNERGRIRDVSDSVPGSTHDLTLLRESGVQAELPDGLTVMGDTGYRGLQNDFPDHSVALPYRPKDKQQLTPEEKLHNHFISSLRIVVENTICELKRFQALVGRFRHSLERHSSVTKAIAGIVNLRIDNRLANQSKACSTAT
jgi:DDE superfamily endonuclease/Helix-turn-helix of DDE superfamily endonuclease